MREREFGPNLFERLARGSEIRRAMIEANLGVWTAKSRLQGDPPSGLSLGPFEALGSPQALEEVEDLQRLSGQPARIGVEPLTEVETFSTDFPSEKAGQILLFSELWERFRKIASWAHSKKLELAAAPALLLAVIGATCESSEPKEPGDTGENLPKVQAPKDKPEQFILPAINTKNPQEPIFLNSGPHSDGLTGGVRAAFDLAGKDVRPCPESETSKEMAAIAAAGGKVTVVGNEKNRADENHSIVEITLESGLTLGYMHLADIQVEVGQGVKQGDILGFLSCEFPPKGKTDGQHLHFYIKKDGKFIPIKGLIFSGWQIDESPQNYQGTAKKGNSRRVANRARCDPKSYQQVADCNGERNDLVEGEVLGARTTAPTATTKPTPIEKKSQEPKVITMAFREHLVHNGVTLTVDRLEPRGRYQFQVTIENDGTCGALVLSSEPPAPEAFIHFFDRKQASEFEDFFNRIMSGAEIPNPNLRRSVKTQADRVNYLIETIPFFASITHPVDLVPGVDKTTIVPGSRWTGTIERTFDTGAVILRVGTFSFGKGEKGVCSDFVWYTLDEKKPFIEIGR